MRICLLSRSLYPLIGGSETYVYTVGEGLTKLGHDVVVITSTLSEGQTSHHHYPFEVRRVAALYDFNAARAPLSVLVPLHAALTDVRADVIHVQNLLLGIALTLIERGDLHRCGIVFTDHSTPIPNQARWLAGIGCYPVELALGRFLFQRGAYDVIVAPSEYFYDWALRCGAPLDRVKLIPHGVDVDRFTPGPVDEVLRKRLCPDLGAFVLLAPGRSVRRKGLVQILDALVDPLLVERHVHLVITTTQHTSEPDYLDDIQRRIEERPLRDRVTLFVDEFPPHEMPDVYRASDCVVFPSCAEGFGLVGLEALACGIPLVARAVAGIDEYLTHEETGLAIRETSGGQIAESVARLMDNPGMRRRLAIAGRELVVSRFRLTDMLRALEGTYASLETVRPRHI